MNPEHMIIEDWDERDVLEQIISCLETVVLNLEPGKISLAQWEYTAKISSKYLNSCIAAAKEALKKEGCQQPHKKSHQLSRGVSRSCGR
jgi:hypothetical protein